MPVRRNPDTIDFRPASEKVNTFLRCEVGQLQGFGIAGDGRFVIVLSFGRFGGGDQGGQAGSAAGASRFRSAAPLTSDILTFRSVRHPRGQGNRRNGALPASCTVALWSVPERLCTLNHSLFVLKDLAERQFLSGSKVLGDIFNQDGSIIGRMDPSS